MRLEDYERICSSLSLGKTPEECLVHYGPLASLSTLQAIDQRVAQMAGRRRIWKFEAMKIPAATLLDRFLERWEGSNQPAVDVIVRMAKELHRVPPCFLARMLVKAYVERMAEPVIVGCDLDALEQQHSSSLPPPPSDPLCGERKTFEEDEGQSRHKRGRPSAAKLYREPEKIPHAGLAENVQHCHAVDPYYSPAMDEMRNAIGKEYEDKLASYLNALGVAYLDEPGMRRMGYARTPDAVLLEPISIDGRIVKWIESKAWFGDPPSHASYLKDQYWPYYNRFGPGLVIYWFGFVDESVEGHMEKGVAVLDHFPSEEGRIIRIESPMLPLVRSTAPITRALEAEERPDGLDHHAT